METCHHSGALVCVHHLDQKVRCTHAVHQGRFWVCDVREWTFATFAPCVWRGTVWPSVAETLIGQFRSLQRQIEPRERK